MSSVLDVAPVIPVVVLDDPTKAVPLARALYSSTEVGQQIPAELFAAVAQVLAFVIGRRNSGRPGGRHDSPRRVEVPQVAPAGHRKRRTPISSAPALAGR